MSAIIDNNTFLAQEGLPGRSQFDAVRGRFETKQTVKPIYPTAAPAVTAGKAAKGLQMEASGKKVNTQWKQITR